MKRKVAWLVLLCFSLGLLLMSGCAAKTPVPENSADDSFTRIKDQGYFVMGLDDALPPMGFRDEANEIVGFDIDMAKEVAERLGVEVKFQSIVWDTKKEELNSGNIDLIWNGFTITEDRKKDYLFSKPYLSDRQIIVVRADSDITGKADLLDKKIGIQAASSANEAVEADEETFEVIKDNLLQFESNDLALRDLKGGGLEAVVVDEVVGRYYLSKHPGDYKVLQENFGVEDFGVGFRLGDKEFHAEVEKALDEMKADGSCAEISVKWFGEDIVNQ